MEDNKAFCGNRVVGCPSAFRMVDMITMSVVMIAVRATEIIMEIGETTNRVYNNSDEKKKERDKAKINKLGGKQSTSEFEL